MLVSAAWLPSPWDTVARIAVAFALAFVVAQLAGRLAAAFVRRYEARHEPGEADTGELASLKRRDTLISLVRTSVRYVAYGIAVAFSIGLLLGNGTPGSGAVLGASLVVVLIGFAAQRFLIDLLTGFFMIFENWFEVGDTVTFEPSSLTGIVEEVSLRSTKLRAVTGETIRVHNGSVSAMRKLARGVREVAVELFVSDEAGGRALVEEAARVVPAGPTQFVQPPRVVQATQLDEGLIQLRALARLAPGREWLANDFLVQVLRERAPAGLLLHGPVIMFEDEGATHRFARAQTGARTGA
jgi:small conductance mechanosensitive channel